MFKLGFEVDGFTFQSVFPDEFIVDCSIIPLFNRYRDTLIDDYWDIENSDEKFRDLIARMCPYFFVIYSDKGEFVGYIFLSDWRAGGTTCAFHIVIDEKHHGLDVLRKTKGVVDKFFNDYNIKRIECTIPVYNKKTIAFASRIIGAKFEGIQKGATQKMGKPLDYACFALVKR